MEEQTSASTARRYSYTKRGTIYERLVALSESGDLAKIRTRAELAMGVGYDASRRNTGYQWVLRMVKRGYIIEKSLGRDPATGDPLYSYELGVKVPPRSRCERATQAAVLPRVVVRTGDLTISMEQMDSAAVASLIKELIRKEEDGR